MVKLSRKLRTTWRAIWQLAVDYTRADLYLKFLIKKQKILRFTTIRCYQCACKIQQTRTGNLAKFVRLVFEICPRTDKHATRCTLHVSRKGTFGRCSL